MNCINHSDGSCSPRLPLLLVLIRHIDMGKHILYVLKKMSLDCPKLDLVDEFIPDQKCPALRPH